MKRKQYTEADYEKRRKRIALFGSLFMVGILFFSTFAYYMNDGNQGSNQMRYGEYEFTFKDMGDGNGVLITSMNGQEVEFQSLPIQVGYLDVDPVAISLIKNAQQVVLAAEPNSTAEDAATVDYARLQLGFAIPKMANAITTADEQYQLPVVNCTVASVQVPVVEFVLSNETKITSSGACILFMGQQRDILLLKDRVIFEYYEILKNGQVVE
jgi:hypothetical protein